LDLAGREEMVAAAMSELKDLGVEAHAKALALKRGVEWESLDPAGPAEMVSAAMSELGHLSTEASQGFGVNMQLCRVVSTEEMTDK